MLIISNQMNLHNSSLCMFLLYLAFLINQISLSFLIFLFLQYFLFCVYMGAVATHYNNVRAFMVFIVIKNTTILKYLCVQLLEL